MASDVKASPVVSVLCYHTFDSPKKTLFTVSSKQFERQLQFLATQRIPVITLQQFLDARSGRGELPPLSVLITVDDGYRTARTVAWPLLKKYGFPATFFIYPQAISHHPTSLKWEDVLWLRDEGADVQSHSMTHPLLTHPGHAMNREQYVAWLDKELAGSRKLLEEKLGRPVTALAYPFGGYDELVVERTTAAGYALAFTCDDANVGLDVDPLKVNRRLVYRTTGERQFVSYVHGLPLKVQDMTPRDGERVAQIPNSIQGRVADVGSIIPESARMLVDKVGNHSFSIKVDSATGAFDVPLTSATKRGYYFVSFMARDRHETHRWREATWIFIVKRNASKKQPIAKVD